MARRKELTVEEYIDRFEPDFDKAGDIGEHFAQKYWNSSIPEEMPLELREQLPYADERFGMAKFGLEQAVGNIPTTTGRPQPTSRDALDTLRRGLGYEPLDSVGRPPTFSGIVADINKAVVASRINGTGRSAVTQLNGVLGGTLPTPRRRR